MSWREEEYKYTPAITENELWNLPDLKLCKTQWIILRAANAPLMSEHVPMFDAEDDFCTHYDEIIVTKSPIESNLIMLQYPPSICYPRSKDEYSPYFHDFVEWTHMKLLVETGHNWILRYGDKVDEYDVPECTLENIRIRTYAHVCDEPGYENDDFCTEYFAEKWVSEKKDSAALPAETQTPTNQWLHVFQNSFLLRISLTVCFLLLIVWVWKCIRNILQKRKQKSEKE